MTVVRAFDLIDCFSHRVPQDNHPHHNALLSMWWQTSWHPGMVCQCPQEHQTSDPSVTTVTHLFKICLKYLDSTFLTHHFRKMTHGHPWRTCTWNDGICASVLWLTFLLLWRYMPSSIKTEMTHPWHTFPGGQEVRHYIDSCITPTPQKKAYFKISFELEEPTSQNFCGCGWES